LPTIADEMSNGGDNNKNSIVIAQQYSFAFPKGDPILSVEPTNQEFRTVVSDRSRRHVVRFRSYRDPRNANPVVPIGPLAAKEFQQ
jgi:hypothetical protein